MGEGDILVSHCSQLQYLSLHNICSQLCETTNFCCIVLIYWGRHGCNRMVVGFATTYAIGAYHHWCCEFESCSGRGVQHYVMKFVCGFLGYSGFLHQYNLPPRYNWNIVESGIKHHKTKPNHTYCETSHIDYKWITLVVIITLWNKIEIFSVANRVLCLHPFYVSLSFWCSVDRLRDEA